MNEEEVGRAIKRGGVPREKLFITTKLWVQDAGYEQTWKAFEKSKQAFFSHRDPKIVKWLGTMKRDL